MSAKMGPEETGGDTSRSRVRIVSRSSSAIMDSTETTILSTVAPMPDAESTPSEIETTLTLACRSTEMAS
jgi:hypothetical protein